MQVNIKKVLSDIEFFKGVITGIRFVREDGSWYKSVPSIAQWNSGDIVLEMDGYGLKVPEMVTRLAHYGIKPEVLSIYGRENNAVKFAAKADDEIIYMLNNALEQKRQARVLQLAKHELAGLTQNVDQLIEQAPYVRHGVGSRGVKAMLNQVAVLKNIRTR